MSVEGLLPLQVFDSQADVLVVHRRLPHWSQAGTICFITWRTEDSMPASVLERWHAERSQWLRAHGVDPNNPAWRGQLHELGSALAGEFHRIFWNRWQDELDAGHGSCVLRASEIQAIVTKSLHHFDGVRYLLLDYIVMPNHVHLLVSFPDEEAMLLQCESWKQYTATRINRAVKRTGRFWQQEAFDHLVRSEAQFQYLRRYIADNPRKAKLPSSVCAHYSRVLPSGSDS
jgi:REP element-mobilizing transposase RayT